jgi:excisionase family DNA binding protein
MKLNRLQYPIEEGANLLGISKNTLKRDIRLGRVAVKHYGRRILIPADELLRIAEHGMKTTEAVTTA